MRHGQKATRHCAQLITLLLRAWRSRRHEIHAGAHRMTTAEPVTCDLLIVNAFAITGDAAFTVLRDGALAILGSEILEVGPTPVLTKRYAARRTIDAADKIVMPGLVNTHNHTPLMATRGMVEDLGFAPAYT